MWERTKLLLQNICIWSIFILWTVFCLPFGYLWVLVCALFPCIKTHTIMRYGIYWHGKIMLWLISPFIPITFSNKSNKTDHQGILIINHQSMLDIYLVVTQPFQNICFVSKSWPYHLLFFFAPMMHSAQYINTELMNSSEILCQCKKRLEDGATLVFYPEGKRTKTGKLQRFHSGVFYLATKLKRNITPMVIHNSFDILSPRHKAFHPSRIYIELLPFLSSQIFLGSDSAHRSMMHNAYQIYYNCLTKRST